MKPLSPHDLIDIYQCEHRVSLKKAIRTEGLKIDLLAPEQVTLDLGENHEIMVVNFLKSKILTTEPTGTFSSTDSELINSLQAHIRSPEKELHGVPDFLLDFEGLKALGVVRTSFQGVEPVDAKLARTSKASAILQVTIYGEMLTRMGWPRPTYGHLALGENNENGFKIESHKLTELYPLVQRLISDHRNAPAILDKSWGARKQECSSCPFSAWCASGRAAADDLTLVPHMNSNLQLKLQKAGIASVKDLSTATGVAEVNPTVFKKLQAQAALLEASKGLEQPLHEWASEANGHPSGALLMLDPGPRDESGSLKDGVKGRLPQADEGDLYFDFEGFPYAPNGGLEYLFGWVDANRNFSYFWCDTEAEEERAYVQFIEFLENHFLQHPQAHLYHYAPYEQTALKRMSEKYQAKQLELKRLLEEGRMVDLFKIVNNSLMVGVSSYSIKKLEPLYMPNGREGEVTTSFGSVEAYYNYLNQTGTKKEKTKKEIIEYNTYDCSSTLELAKWLRERREEATQDVMTIGEVIAGESSEKTLEKRQLIASYAQQLQSHPAPYAKMLSLMVGYYDREAKVYWDEFARKRSLSSQEIASDEATFEVKGILEVKSIPKARSRALVRLDVEISSPLKGSLMLLGNGLCSAEVDDQETNGFWVKTDPNKLKEALSGRTIMQKAPVAATIKESALMLLCEKVLTGPSTSNAGFEVITRTPLGYRSDAQDVTKGVVESVMKLPLNAYLGVQGPPGAGKSRLAGQIITTALSEGWKVGVSCVANKAISSLLEVVQNLGVETLTHKSGVKEEKENQRDIRVWSEDSFDRKVLGGTTFGWAALAKKVLEGEAEPVDLLVVDEASQMPLVDLVALASSAKRIVFLGDPQQLAHIAQGQHEEEVDVSILGHLVGDEPVILERHGFFLDETWRFPSSVSKVVSDLAYNGRLRSNESTEKRSLDGLSGVFSQVVSHSGCSTHSKEEAGVILKLVEDLIGRIVLGLGGGRKLEPQDILIVAPYNDQVKLISETLKAKGYPQVQVGTVDKFQGQQAPVTIYSMTASDHAAGGRGAGFVLDVARLNVAISRTQTIAILVGSEGLIKGTSSVESLYQASRACWLLGFSPWLA